MKTILLGFSLLAAGGLLLSMVVHICALAGIPNPLGKDAWALHIGIFVVWIPAVMSSHSMTRNARPKDAWKVTFGNCPPWMRYLTNSCWAYAIINFLIFAILSDKRDESSVFRGFSGHWMAFYSAAMSILYSAAYKERLGPSACPCGHSISPAANFCEECGAQIHKGG